MIEREITLVLTASIRAAAAVARSSPEVRLADYRTGLEFWLQLPDRRIRRIIFLENTGYPLTALESAVRSHNPFGREIEFVSIDCNEIPEGVHYGYSEFRLLDLGLAQSRLYASSDLLLKATGRYLFPAVTRLLDRLPADCVCAADIRYNGWFVRWPQQFITSALMLFTKKFFEENVRHLHREMRPAPPFRRQFIEDLLFDYLLPLYARPGVVLRWPVNCDPHGVGGNGRPLFSWRRRVLSAARSTGRRLIPAWWF